MQIHAKKKDNLSLYIKNKIFILFGISLICIYLYIVYTTYVYIYLHIWQQIIYEESFSSNHFCTYEYIFDKFYGFRIILI